MKQYSLDAGRNEDISQVLRGRFLCHMHEPRSNILRLQQCHRLKKIRQLPEHLATGNFPDYKTNVLKYSGN